MNNNYIRNVQFLGPSVINVFVLSLLILTCFYLYEGFQNIYYTITQDYIANYVAPRYMLSHPSFAFVMAFPNFVPLLYLFYFMVQCLTNDIQCLNVFVSLSIHIINTFILFKTIQILSDYKLFPGLFAALFYLVSMIHIDSLLSFSHARPVITSFFGLLSIYFFAKVIYTKDVYKKKHLYFSILLFLLSISCGADFIGLILFYLLIMLIRIKYFKRDFFYILFIISSYFVIVFLLRKIFIHRYIYNMNDMPVFVSLAQLWQKINNYEYPFFSLIAHFFHGFSQTLASILNDNISYYYNRSFSLFILFIPLVFFNKEKIKKLYSVWILIFLLFIPYVFKNGPLADRHFAHVAVASSLFLGLLFHYTFGMIYKIKIIILRKILRLLLILLLQISLLKFIGISKREVGIFIRNFSPFSPFIKKFMEEFKNIEIHNEKKQIYFLKNEIPNEYSFMKGADYYCFYIFYLAIKYKKLPVDLYPPVYMALHSLKFDRERCKNYFISLSDGDCFGFYTDKNKVKELIDNNPDISLKDVIELEWDDGLKQGHFDLTGIS